MCCECGQLYCGNCATEIERSFNACPVCRASFSASPQKRMAQLQQLAARSPGRQTALAHLDLARHGDKSNPAKSRQLCLLATSTTEAAVKATAHWRLFTMFQHGHGGPRNLKLARKHCKLAADGGNANAQYKLCAMYLHGTSGMPKDGALAWKYLNATAHSKDTPNAEIVSEAQYMVGSAFRFGHADYHIDINAGEAKKWLRRAACGDGNNEDAMHSLAVMSYACCSDRGDAMECLKYARILARLRGSWADDGCGMILGLYYEAAEGEAVDLGLTLKEAYTAGLRAARSGHPAAQTMLAELYFRGHGGLQNATDACKWLAKAASRGDTTAQTTLAKVYAGNSYQTPQGKAVPKNAAKALALFLQAAEQGDAESAFNVGDLLDRGAEGVPQDRAEAYKWYRRYAEVWAGAVVPKIPGGEVDRRMKAQAAIAQGRIGDFHCLGAGGADRNLASATTWYKLAERAAKGLASMKKDLQKRWKTIAAAPLSTPGMRVEVFGLTSGTCNGRHGIVQERKVKHGRVAVTLEGGTALVSIRLSNVRKAI